MTDEITRLLVHGGSKLAPSDAVVAIIKVEGRFLLQSRDVMEGIFYPGHWGLFGGAIDPGETKIEALGRELMEELQFDMEPAGAKPFTTMTFDLSFAEGGRIERWFYEIDMPINVFRTLRLNEGREMRLFSAEEALAPSLPVTPYDAFAIWLSVARRRLNFTTALPPADATNASRPPA